MGLTVTFTASMGETLAALQALVLAHHAMLASAVQTARQPILAKLHLHLLTVGLMVTFTASMEEILGESQGHARALPATLALVVQTVLPALQAIVDHLLTIALLIPAKPLLPSYGIHYDWWRGLSVLHWLDVVGGSSYGSHCDW